MCCNCIEVKVRGLNDFYLTASAIVLQGFRPDLLHRRPRVVSLFHRLRELDFHIDLILSVLLLSFGFFFVSGDLLFQCSSISAILVFYCFSVLVFQF